MSIDLRLIRFASALAEHGSFTRAAEALGIAQPTLSRAIADLEESVGQALFNRRRHGVEPTDFGYLFLRQAASVEAQMADLEREVALAKGLHKGELAVGFGPYAADLLLPRVLPDFVSRNPGSRLRIQIESLEILGRALRERSLDLVVGESTVLEDDESIEILESLEPLRGYAFVRAGHPLCTRPVSLRDVFDYPLIQVSRLPPRVLRPLLEALGLPSKSELPRAVPALDCATVSFGISAMLGSDAVMLASLGMMKTQMERDHAVALVHQDFLRTQWAFMKLRHRSLGPVATGFMAALRAAHSDSVREDRRLHQRFSSRLPSATPTARPDAPKESTRRAR